MCSVYRIHHGHHRSSFNRVGVAQLARPRDPALSERPSLSCLFPLSPDRAMGARPRGLPRPGRGRGFGTQLF